MGRSRGGAGRSPRDAKRERRVGLAVIMMWAPAVNTGCNSDVHITHEAHSTASGGNFLVTHSPSHMQLSDSLIFALRVQVASHVAIGCGMARSPTPSAQQACVSGRSRQATVTLKPWRRPGTVPRGATVTRAAKAASDDDDAIDVTSETVDEGPVVDDTMEIPPRPAPTYETAEEIPSPTSDDEMVMELEAELLELCATGAEPSRITEAAAVLERLGGGSGDLPGRWEMRHCSDYLVALATPFYWSLGAALGPQIAGPVFDTLRSLGPPLGAQFPRVVQTFDAAATELVSEVDMEVLNGPAPELPGEGDVYQRLASQMASDPAKALEVVSLLPAHVLPVLSITLETTAMVTPDPVDPSRNSATCTKSRITNAAFNGNSIGDALSFVEAPLEPLLSALQKIFGGSEGAFDSIYVGQRVRLARVPGAAELLVWEREA
ncbi:hypothetical protein CYMTET_19073 [Cymbomonas tetramitiformis]|uniref:Uncharacterized protein n=1 Tax=Cymbomonas tetramitiformis TaxID=36881 RepID=A0AAE0G763_9CHLO|nr:hypothetical protein CYMTET_19073 [Cymbomonas tetramitiformis]